jgi:hypothetical protein
MKYLVVKGYLGFGDRLETLKMCVNYALHNNLQIYVDWTDPIWTHGGETFYTYFKFVNMPVLNSLDDIPADATYYPSYWNHDNIKNPCSEEFLRKRKETGIDVGILGPSIPTKADVLVHCSVSSRSLYPDSSFFARVFRVINPDILAGIRSRLSRAQLSNCIGIHARGTDRAKRDVRKEHSIQFMALAAMPFASKQMIAVGDDAYSIELWKRFYPNTHVFTTLAQSNTTNKGNHLATKDELKHTKYELTVEFLVDFFTLALCERVISTFKDSRFAQEARRLHPVVKQILDI